MEPFDSKPQNPSSPVAVPIEMLSDDALRAVLESFIMREGTDYGAVELQMETKVANLKRKIELKQAHLIFDPDTESITFMTDREWRRNTCT